jgi:hypothetical protein
MPEDIDLKLVDKRVVARYLEKGRLDEKDYEKHLMSLPDLAEEAVPIESDLEAVDLEEEEEEEAEELAQAGQPEAASEAAAPTQPTPQPSQAAEAAQPPAAPPLEPQGS